MMCSNGFSADRMCMLKGNMEANGINSVRFVLFKVAQRETYLDSLKPLPIMATGAAHG